MIKHIWTDGTQEDFQRFYRITEDYYSSIMGGADRRKSFMPYTQSLAIIRFQTIRLMINWKGRPVLPEIFWRKNKNVLIPLL